MINLGIKGLAKYMTSAEATRRKILHDYKHPEPEGLAQARYYAEAKALITRFVRGTLDRAEVLQEAARLQAEGSTVGRQRGTKLKCNGRAVTQYVRYFGAKEMTLLPPCKLELVFDPVRIAITPELHAHDGRRERLIRLEFANDLAANGTRIIAQSIFEAAIQAEMEIPSSAVSVWRLADGTMHGGARMGSRMRKDIEAACKNIAAIWPSI